MPETIYSERDAFFLEIQGMDYKVREPVLWNKVEIAIERDIRKHGVDVNFPSKDSTLEFSNVPEDETGNRAKNLIDAEYALKGLDAEILIKFGTWDGFTFTEITRQKLDLAKKYENGLHTTITAASNLTIKQRIEDFYDAEIRLEDTVDVLGDSISLPAPPPQEKLNLHSQKIVKKLNKLNPDEILVEGADYFLSGGVTQCYIQWGFDTEVLKGAMEDFNLPNGVSLIDPISVSRSNYISKDSGLLQVPVIIAIADIKGLTLAAGQPYQFDTYVTMHDANVNNRRDFLIGSIAGVGTGSPINVNAVGGTMYQQDILYVKPEQHFTIWTDCTFGANAVFTSINFVKHNVSVGEGPVTVRQNEVAIDFNTTIGGRIVNGYRLKEAIKYLFKSIAGDDVFISNTFFDAAGNGHDFFLYNGFMLRGLAGFNRSPAFSAKDAFEALNTMFAIGENVEIDASNNITVVWEEVEHFYQDHEIIDLSSRTSDFMISSDKQLSINTVKFGYKRLSVRETNGEGSIDAVNTQIESSLPIEVATRRVNLRSPWRTEGYDIETAKRTSVIEKETTNVDDDIFIINSEPGVKQITATVSFLANTGELSSTDTALYDFLLKYGEVTVSGTASNNGVQRPDAANTRKIITGAFYRMPFLDPLVDEFSVSATFTSTAERSRTNEEFDLVAFVETDPNTLIETDVPADSIYNAILKPLRLLMQHAKWLNGALWYKLSTVKYKTLKHLNSDNFKTQLNVGAAHKYGDINTQVLVAKDDVEKQYCYEGKSLFTPNIFKFNAEISRADFILIKDAMMGQGATPYGYISTIDNDGNKVSGYLLSMSGDPNANYYEIELREKGDFYA